MATAFAGEYVQQISPDLTRIVGAEIFDVSIGCYSLASPRVFGPKEAAAFCCLTQAGELCKTDPDAAGVVVPDSYVKGRISYLRVVTTLDLVTALPKVGYEHPCSEFKKGQREMITLDCDIEAEKTIVSNGNAFITNKASKRCLNLEHKRPAMTADFSKAPVCTYKRKKTLNISSMLYHLTYCGIMFAGGVDINSALSLDVETLQKDDINAATAAANPDALGIKADNTMMRILWYGFNQVAIAKCVFFDLVPFRVKETMAQGGGGGLGGLFGNLKNKLTKNRVAPETQAAPSTPAAQAAPVAATPVAATPVATPAAQPDSSLLLEDSKMTNAFIVGLKKDIADAKYDYDYPITNAAFKPPILYKPLPIVKGGVPPPHDYNYLYQLPADIVVKGSRFTLFFGKAQGPPREHNADGTLILNDEEKKDMQQHLDDHHNLVSADHIAAANTAVAAINAAQGTPNPLVLPPLPSIPQQLAPANSSQSQQPAAPAKPLISPPLPSRPIPNYDPANSSNLYFYVTKPHEGPERFDCKMSEIQFSDGVNRFICTNPEVPVYSVPNTVYTKNGEKYDAIGNYRKSNDTYEFVTPPAKGGRRTRRKSLPKTRKHRKGINGNKCNKRTSRRGKRNSTKRHHVGHMFAKF